MLKKLLLDFKKIIFKKEFQVIIVSLLVFILMHKFSYWEISSNHYRLLERRFFQAIYFFVIPILFIVFRLKQNPLDFGLKGTSLKQSFRYLLLLILIMIPAVFFISHTKTFIRYYPQYRPILTNFDLFLIYEAIMLFHLAGWEWIFRGFLLFGLKQKLGDQTSIMIQTIPFVVFHITKPTVELFGSIIAGVILGIIAIRTHSIWPGVIAHWLVQLFLDMLIIQKKILY